MAFFIANKGLHEPCYPDSLYNDGIEGVVILLLPAEFSSGVYLVRARVDDDAAAAKRVVYLK